MDFYSHRSGLIVEMICLLLSIRGASCAALIDIGRSWWGLFSEGVKLVVGGHVVPLPEGGSHSVAVSRLTGDGNVWTRADPSFVVLLAVVANGASQPGHWHWQVDTPHATLGLAPARGESGNRPRMPARPFWHNPGPRTSAATTARRAYPSHRRGPGRCVKTMSQPNTGGKDGMALAGSATDRFRVGLLTVSDTAAQDPETDLTGPALRRHPTLTSAPFEVAANRIVPDDAPAIAHVVKEWTDAGLIDLVLTLGGTGCGRRDKTPEVSQLSLPRWLALI